MVPFYQKRFNEKMQEHHPHILFLTPGFAANEKDSSCIPALQDFTSSLVQLNPEITISIVTLHYPNTQGVYSWNNINVYSLGANNCRFPNRFYYWYQLRKLVLRIHQTQPINLVHSFWYDELAYLGQRLAKQMNVPIYCTFMGQDAIQINHYTKRIKIPKDHLVALSDFHHAMIEEHLHLNVRNIIPWSVPSMYIPNSEKVIDVINIGSFNEVKQQDEAIRILKEVIQQKPALRCVFVGGGTRLSRAKQMVNELGLEANISFTGTLDRSSTLALLSQSKVLLHTSSYESFGTIFIEAMTCKTTIVSRAIGIAEKSDWWKIYDNPKQAISALTELLDNFSPPDPIDFERYGQKALAEAYSKLWNEGIKKGRT